MKAGQPDPDSWLHSLRVETQGVKSPQSRNCQQKRQQIEFVNHNSRELADDSLTTR